jgi:hypothetical protein
MLFFNRNDPKQNYFLRLTFAGVRVVVDVGLPIDAGASGTDRAAPAAGVTGGGGAAAPSPSPGLSAGSAVVPPSPLGSAAGGADTATPVLTAGHRSYDLAEPWRAWPALAAAVGASAVGAWLARRRLLGWWGHSADRYLRG